MNRIKINFSLVFMALMFVPLLATGSDDFLCVSIEVPEFRLVSDSACAISESNVTQSTVPDQDLLYDLGYPAGATCFRFAKPAINPWDPSEPIEPIFDGIITYQGLSIDIKLDGMVGSTSNHYPNGGTANGVTSFTGISLFNIYYSITGSSEPNDLIKLGSVVNRDAGATLANINVIGGRLSVAKGTGLFTNVVGYIDGFGPELVSAQGIGKYCFPLNNGGNHMSNKTSNDRKSDILNKLFNPLIIPVIKIESKLF